LPYACRRAERFPDEIETLLEAKRRALDEVRALPAPSKSPNRARVHLLLDAHVSGSSVGGQLRNKGHDVRALHQEPEVGSRRQASTL
jgi:hypothetical protein